MVLQNKNAYPQVCFDLLSHMEGKWREYLTYHNISHTIDVANVCDKYISHYNINEFTGQLMRIAAIGHDIGYLSSPNDHEEVGIVKLKPFLEPLFNSKQIEMINGMIRATKVPQNPTSFYEEILADADLDYLGRKDYDVLSVGLYKEFLYYNLVSSEMDWLNIQINFFENHSYHTSLAIATRTAAKNIKLEALKQKRLNLER